MIDTKNLRVRRDEEEVWDDYAESIFACDLRVCINTSRHNLGADCTL